MERPVTHHPPEAVLEHLDWLRALARRLCADASRADDVSQEALLAAWRKPPRADASLKEWLVGVVANLARRERRGEGRRHGREREAARREKVPSTLELLERMSVEERLLQAVRSLREPYRTTVLLRYFEGLAPRAIARRTSTPEGTVKTRLKRGLAQLREVLDADFGGDGRQWLLALGPLASLRRGGWPGPGAFSEAAKGALTGAATGAMTMNAKLVVVPGLLAVVGAGLWWGTRSTSQTEPERAQAELEAPQVELEPVARAAEPSAVTAAERVALAAASPEAIGAIEADPVVETQAWAGGIEVLVVDLDDRALAGVALAVLGFGEGDPSRAPLPEEALTLPEGRTAVTDAEGRASFAGLAYPCSVFVSDPAYVGINKSTLLGKHESDYVLVATRSRSIEGRVFDERWNLLPGAEVSYAPYYDVRSRVDRVLDFSEKLTWRTVADENGMFSLPRVPELPEARVHGSHFGVQDTTAAVGTHGNQQVDLILLDPDEEDVVLRGVVLDASGERVAQAWVSAGRTSTQTDASGRFELSLDDDVTRPVVVNGVAEGHLPGRYEHPEGARWPESLEIVLGGRPLELRGRVVTTDGEPVDGVRVRILDGTPFGWVPFDTNERSFSTDVELEAMVRGDAMGWGFETDSNGRFTIGGLLDRSYRLFLAHPERSSYLDGRVVVPGGAEVEFVLPDPPPGVELKGRVVGLDGEPFVGVRVQARNRVAFDGREELLNGPLGVTSEDGSFRIENVTLEGLSLGLSGGPVPNYLAFDPGEDVDPEHLEVVVRRSCHFRVRLVDSALQSQAQAFRLLGEDGEPLELQSREGMIAFGRFEGTLRDGRSQVMSTLEGRATLVLYAHFASDDEPELARVPVTLTPEGINELDV